MAWTDRLRRGAVGLLLVGLVAGCAAEPRRGLSPHMAGEAGNLAALRGSLAAFEEESGTLIESAADSIMRQDASRSVREASLLWKTRMIGRFEDKLGVSDPRVGLLDGWVLAAQMSEFLTSGQGARLFGEQQPIAIQTAEQVLRMIEELAEGHLTDDRYAQARRAVRELSAERPLVGLFQESRPAAAQVSPGLADPLVRLFMLPLAPFQAAAKVEEGVETVRDLVPVVERMTAVAGDLPRRARWELELLLLGLDENPAVGSALGSIERLSESGERLTRSVADLPDILDANRSVQSGLKTIERFADSADRAVELLDEWPDRLDHNATMQALLMDLERLSTSAEVASRTVAALPDLLDRSAAVQSALAISARFSQSGDRFSRAAADLADTFDRRAERLEPGIQRQVDHIAWRAAQLLVLAAALGAGLLALSRLWRARTQTGGG